MDEGIVHEKQVLHRLASELRPIAHVETEIDPMVATLGAMTAGTAIVYQAHLADEQFAGVADFLIRVDGVSCFGDFRYEVWDAKLGQSMKPQYAIQLCCYADMLAGIGGVLPDHFGVFLATGEQRRLRSQDYFYYYRVVRDAFLRFQDGVNISEAPDPADYRVHGRWTTYAKQLLEAADDLSGVANIRSIQLKRVRNGGVRTIQELNTSGPTPHIGTPGGGA